MQPRLTPPTFAAAIGILVAGAAGTGCTLQRPAPTSVEYARPYPQGLPREATLDIHVLRHPQRIELTNTTTRAFGPSTVWLNAQYSRPIDGLAVGETISLPLGEFRNEYSDVFRAGGFFATEDPTPLVLAEIESDDRRWGLIVASDATE